MRGGANIVIGNTVKLIAQNLIGVVVSKDETDETTVRWKVKWTHAGINDQNEYQFITSTPESYLRVIPDSSAAWARTARNMKELGVQP